MTHLEKWVVEIDMSEFAKRLKELREDRNITQARLSELLAIDPRAYNRWERGGTVPQLETLVKIADVLQVTLDELVGRTTALSPPHIRNQRLMELYLKLDLLNDEEQKAAIVLIDSLVTRADMQRMIGESQQVRR